MIFKLIFIIIIAAIIKNLWRAYKLYKLVSDKSRVGRSQEKNPSKSGSTIEAEYKVIKEE
jgi:hypothetical protein